MKWCLPFFLLIVVLAGCGSPESPGPGEDVVAADRSAEVDERKELDLLQAESPREFRSQFLEEPPLLVLPGVFVPFEAESAVLPFLKENADFFTGKRVLEIGTGTGIISVYAALLGAEKVVSTDISEMAVANATENAKRFGVDAVMQARLVPETDISAYSVIADDEAFDIIISNPPYSLDLDADENTAVTDRGDLGFSIVRGLDRHLEPGGVAMLFYGSLFYHHVMVKFARHEGYDVKYHIPSILTALEAETLFNSYLARLLEAERIEANAFRFHFRDDEGLWRLFVASDEKRRPAPLMPGNSERWFHGIMVIRRPGDAGATTSP